MTGHSELSVAPALGVQQFLLVSESTTDMDMYININKSFKEILSLSHQNGVYQNVIEECSITMHCGTGYAPAAEEAEAGGFYVQDQPVLQRDFKDSLNNLYSFSKLKTKGHCDGSVRKGVCCQSE